MKKLLASLVVVGTLAGCAHGHVDPVIAGAVVGAGVGYVASQHSHPAPHYGYYPKPVYGPAPVYVPPPRVYAPPVYVPPPVYVYPQPRPYFRPY